MSRLPTNNELFGFAMGILVCFEPATAVLLIIINYFYKEQETTMSTKAKNTVFGFDLATDSTDTYDWPVYLSQPVNGDFKRHKVWVKFNFIGDVRMEELKEIDFDDEQSEFKSTAMEVLGGWGSDMAKGTFTSNGAVIDYSEDAKAELLDKLWISTSMVKAFFASQSGKKQK